MSNGQFGQKKKTYDIDFKAEKTEKYFDDEKQKWPFCIFSTKHIDQTWKGFIYFLGRKDECHGDTCKG